MCFFKGFKTAGLTAAEAGRAVGRPARGASPARRAPPRFGIRVEVQGILRPAGRGGTTMGRCLGLGGCLTKFQTAGNAEKHCRAKRRPPLRRAGGATQPSREQARTATLARSSVPPPSNTLPPSLKSCPIAFSNAQPGALWAPLAERQAEMLWRAVSDGQECEQDSGGRRHDHPRRPSTKRSQPSKPTSSASNNTPAAMIVFAALWISSRSASPAPTVSPLSSAAIIRLWCVTAVRSFTLGEPERRS